MKVFVIGNRNDDLAKKSFDNIVKDIEKLGHKVDSSWIKHTSDEDALHFEDAYKRSMKSIKNADILVAEVSTMSSGIGFLISTALNQKMPVLALFNDKSKDKQSMTLKGSKNKLMHYTTYNGDNLDKEIKNFFTKTKSLLDTKFILIISPDIDKYLEWASSTKRMHKAQIVRNAVEDQMAKDKDWKSFIA
jgi:nucleoside 2-deoxyribosyltransferase